MKIKLKAILAVVTMIFCFGSPAFAGGPNDNGFPKPPSFDEMQYIETRYFTTPAAANAYVQLKTNEGFTAYRDDEYNHNTKTWIYRVKVYM